MIKAIEIVLRDLLVNEVPLIAADDQVRFEPPGELWAGYVTNVNDLVLNVCLAEVRENRTLRSNERTLEFTNGHAVATAAPERLDCHYLVSAWSPAVADGGVEPSLEEHELLYQTAGVLLDSRPLNPTRVYPPGSAALTAVPAPIRDADLPLEVVPPEGFVKLAEFWGTMGATRPWRPVLHLILTVPVLRAPEPAGPMVRTRITEYRLDGRPETAELWIQIGGEVKTAAGGAVGDAWVGLESAAGAPLASARTSSSGRFVFGELRAGSYALRVRAAGRPERVEPIDVPAPTGTYDVELP